MAKDGPRDYRVVGWDRPVDPEVEYFTKRLTHTEAIKTRDQWRSEGLSSEIVKERRPSPVPSESSAA